MRIKLEKSNKAFAVPSVRYSNRGMYVTSIKGNMQTSIASGLNLSTILVIHAIVKL